MPLATVEKVCVDEPLKTMLLKFAAEPPVTLKLAEPSVLLLQVGGVVRILFIA